MITFFTSVRDFRGEFDGLQRRAIASWLAAVPGAEVILMGDRYGVSAAADDLGVRYLPGVACNAHGTERFDDLFSLTGVHARHDILCEISADIMLEQGVDVALATLDSLDRFLVIGQRWDVDGDGLRALHDPCGIDYFLYRCGTLGEIPPFAVGRTAYDQWLVWAAVARWGLTVIDATGVITALHVNHGYPDWENGKRGLFESDERAENHRLARATGCDRWYTVHDAPYVMTAKGLLRREQV